MIDRKDGGGAISLPFKSFGIPQEIAASTVNWFEAALPDLAVSRGESSFVQDVNNLRERSLEGFANSILFCSSESFRIPDIRQVSTRQLFHQRDDKEASRHPHVHVLCQVQDGDSLWRTSTASSF